MMIQRTNQEQKQKIDQALENRILLGLAMEWKAAQSDLTFDEIQLMTAPVFTLKNGSKSLAHWDPERREIAFSRSFVKDYSWDSVREVLRHEMAHQYAHDVLCHKNETAHGPAFHKACERLRANPKASGTYPPLTDRLHGENQSPEDKIMGKIKKLLALGQSTNPHESQAALAKARQLIDAFNVDMIDSQKDPSFISLFVGRPTLRRFSEEYMIASLLVDYYHVYGIWVSSFVLEKGKMGRVFEITGRPENVKTAAYVYDFVMNQINMAWNALNASKKLGRYRKSDFACGLIQGFSDRLKKERQKEKGGVSDKKDLVSLNPKDPALMAYATYKYPRIRSVTRSAGGGDDSIRKKGRDIGRKLALAKGVSQDDQGVKALIYDKT